MTNQRRSRFNDLLTTDDSSDSRDRVMRAFWVATDSTTNAQVIDLAARRSRAL